MRKTRKKLGVDPVLLGHERMVFEAENWGIIIVNEEYKGLSHLRPYASHKTCPKTASIWGYRCWDTQSDVQVCGHCGGKVPECILTLIRIEEWKR
jgi:hypothetical protein